MQDHKAHLTKLRRNFEMTLLENSAVNLNIYLEI